MYARDVRSADIRGGLIGAADVLTMSTNRLLLSGPAVGARVHAKRHRRSFPTWNQTNPRNAEYQRHASEGFKNWRLPIAASSRVRASCRSTRSSAARSNADHRAHLRTGMVSDRRVDRRAAPAGARRSGGVTLPHATSSSTRSTVVRGIRSVRSRASPRRSLRTGSTVASFREARVAAASPRRTSVRV
jgi:hypothetical protein